MFGPNKEQHRVIDFSYHHRSPEYIALVGEVGDLFFEKGLVPDDYWVCLVSGSGTLALETVMFSLLEPARVMGGSEEFSGRIGRQLLAHEKFSAGGPNGFHVLYETNDSRYYPVTHQPERLLVVDGVSAFPYYPVPPEADIFVTVSSKQLGALPVVGLVFVRDGAWPSLCSAERYSCLNLRRHKGEARNRPAVPHTPQIANVISLRDELLALDIGALRARVDARRAAIERIVPVTQRVGEGPVMSLVPVNGTTDLVREFGLYHKGPYAQIFLTSGSDLDFERLIRRLECLYGEG